MTDAQVLGRVWAQGCEFVLYHRDGVFEIRMDGLELMSSRAHDSAEALARLACAHLTGRSAPRVLLGGLGMGYTLRAALDCLPQDATVVVAEVFQAVVDWNRGPLAHLARYPLADPRVTVVTADVVEVLSSGYAPFDGILQDVDNGPSALALPSNLRLYDAAGVALHRRALAPGGILAVWSAYPEEDFVRQLEQGGFRVWVEPATARGVVGDPVHQIILATPVG